MLHAKSVDGLVFSNNRLTRGQAFRPYHARKATLTFEACRRVRVVGNRVAEDVLGRNIVLSGTPPLEVTVGPNQAWIR